MTAISNIHVGLTAWAAGQVVSIGTRRSSNSAAWQATNAGTTGATAPSGAVPVSDGTITWTWLSLINYTTLAAWHSAIPSTLTQPVIGQVWNDGTIPTVAGTVLLTFSGKTTTTTNTITLTCAPGESIRDSLAAGSALVANTASGVSITMPTATSSTHYITVSENNVIIDGIQFIDPATVGTGFILFLTGTNTGFVLRNCLFDGSNKPGGQMFACPGVALAYNNIFIDRQSVSGTNAAIALTAAGTKLINNTHISTNATTTGAAIYCNTNTGQVMKNSAMMGYGPAAAIQGDVANMLTVDHSVFSAASQSSTTYTNGGSNLFSKTVANQFVSTTVDFRLKAGADCLDAGVTDTTDIPEATDMAGTARPQGSAWDVGCYEFPVVVAQTSYQPWYQRAPILAQ